MLLKRRFLTQSSPAFTHARTPTHPPTPSKSQAWTPTCTRVNTPCPEGMQRVDRVGQMWGTGRSSRPHNVLEQASWLTPPGSISSCMPVTQEGVDSEGWFPNQKWGLLHLLQCTASLTWWREPGRAAGVQGRVCACITHGHSARQEELSWTSRAHILAPSWRLPEGATWDSSTPGRTAPRS